MLIFLLRHIAIYHVLFVLQEQNGSKKKEFSLEKIEELFNQFEENEVLRVSLEGGEPFTRKDIIQIMHLADNHNFSYWINTNATLITEELAKAISMTNVDKLCISIDGPEEIHDLSRGVVGSYKKMTQAIKYLQKYNVQLDGIITLTKINKDYLFETLQLISSLGIKTVAIMIMATVGNAYKNKNRVEINYDEWKEIYLKLTDIKKTSSLPVDVAIVPTGESAYPWLLYLPLIETNRENDINLWIANDSMSTVSEKCYACTAGKDNFAIDGYGNVFGCSLMYTEKSLIAGNVYDKTISEIWKNSPIFNTFRNLKLEEINGECKKCKYLNLCKGGCRVCAYTATKDLNGSDIRCPLCMEGKENG